MDGSAQLNMTGTETEVARVDPIVTHGERLLRITVDADPRAGCPVS